MVFVRSIFLLIVPYAAVSSDTVFESNLLAMRACFSKPMI